MLLQQCTDIWLLWPDGTMCPLDESNEYEYMSDDYHLVDVLAYDEFGSPQLWEYVLN